MIVACAPLVAEHLSAVPAKITPTVGALHRAAPPVLFYITLAPGARHHNFLIPTLLAPLLHGNSVLIVGSFPLFVRPTLHPLVFLGILFPAQTTEHGVALFAHSLATLSLRALTLRPDENLRTVSTWTVDDILHAL